MRKDNNDLAFQNLNMAEEENDNMHEIERHLTNMNFLTVRDEENIEPESEFSHDMSLSQISQLQKLGSRQESSTTYK